MEFHDEAELLSSKNRRRKVKQPKAQELALGLTIHTYAAGAEHVARF